MYKVPKMKRSQIRSVEVVEGETIEKKIERILQNNEPIKDGAPEIFTERKDGVIAAYNIRTDRWEVAADAMDMVSRSIDARRDARMGATDKEAQMIDGGKDTGNEGVSGAKSTEGTATGGDTK